MKRGCLFERGLLSTEENGEKAYLMKTNTPDKIRYTKYAIQIKKIHLLELLSSKIRGISFERGDFLEGHGCKNRRHGENFEK